MKAIAASTASLTQLRGAGAQPGRSARKQAAQALVAAREVAAGAGATPATDGARKVRHAVERGGGRVLFRFAGKLESKAPGAPRLESGA